MVGSTVSHYRIEEQIGEGGMGVVYRARDLTLNRSVAVKFLSEMAVDGTRRRRFQFEAEAASSLNHPHILSVFEVGVHDGQPYIVTEYVDGSTLRDWVWKSSPSVRQLLETLVPVAEALATAHEAGLVHRDVKPANVLVAKAGYAKLADFGLAKLLDDTIEPAAGAVTRTVTRAGVVVGTVAYMSPEQAVGKPVDHRSDIFSFGVMTYELLAGVRPFAGETDVDVLHAIQRTPPTPLAQRRRDLPAELSVAIEKALEKDPADRYQSMREVVVDLKRALKGRSGSSAEVQASPATRPRGATRRVVPYVAIGVLVGAAALATALGPWTRDDPVRRLETLLDGASPQRLTDFDGWEVDAVISPDGKYVAFVSDRDGPFDVYLTQVGSGVFSNLTQGTVPGLWEPEIRTVGFTPDGNNVWVRTRSNTQVSTALLSVLGGTLRPFVNGASVTWSPDGRKLAYHQSVPGDPIWVADPDGSNARHVAKDPPGLHNHYLAWTADGAGLYAAHGYPPSPMDLWRRDVDSPSSAPVRLTRHNAQVSYPALLDPDTLLYIATAADSSDQTLFALDLPSGTSRRIMPGVEQYISVAAGGGSDSRRLALTVARPTAQMWTIPITDGIVDETAATRVTVPTAIAHGPRFAGAAIFYRSSRGGPESLWRCEQSRASVWWSAQGGLTSAPAVSPDGGSIAVVVRNQDRSTLRVMDADGTNVRALAPALDVRDPPSWSKDSKWIAVGAIDDSGGRIYKVPIDGGTPVRLVDEQSRAPQWSPDGSYIVYTTPVRGATSALHAVTPDKKPRTLPEITVTRFEERYHFVPPDGHSLIVLGPGGSFDFFLVDLATGRQRQLTQFRDVTPIESFDISPDGQTILFDRVNKNADIYTIDLKPHSR
jgi:Tol biopolymer transport system component